MKEQTSNVLLKVQVLEKRLGRLALILVLALCGLVVEACIIYRLHTHPTSGTLSAYNASYDQQNKLNILSARLGTCEHQLQKIQDHKEVAFTAALQPSSWDGSGYGVIGPFNKDITLKHGNVLTNVGGAYSNKGVFIAPVRGVYFFTFTTYSWVAEKDIGVRLMKNNEEVLLVWETQDKGDNEDYASNSVLLELEVGDKVYMRLPKGYQVAASVKSNIHTFSGFLLYSRSIQ
ncbi:complement C1q-like protein 2 [Alosa pseudoharengus]|uniref:complement C1q-like protein 2 n=1 Tax=Alosa pseudoharengus TaxID=34774 RepID=UPI003F8AC04D